jgi:peroxiredoxin
MTLLRDRSPEFDEAGVAVYGVSRDSPYTHIAWAQVLDLTFTLLSDWNGEAT